MINTIDVVIVDHRGHDGVLECKSIKKYQNALITVPIAAYTMSEVNMKHGVSEKCLCNSLSYNMAACNMLVLQICQWKTG